MTEKKDLVKLKPKKEAMEQLQGWHSNIVCAEAEKSAEAEKEPEYLTLTTIFMTRAMDDSLRGLAFANRCNSSEIIHQAISEYTYPVKKEQLSALKNEKNIPDENMHVWRSLHVPSADYEKVKVFAHQEGISRAVMFRDILQKHIDKNPRTP